MPDSYVGSRSPVRALNPASQARSNAVTRPRSWIESPFHDGSPVARPIASEPVPLDCPDCGSTLHLALVPVMSEPRPVEPTVASAGDDDVELPDFEDSVRSFKRDLIARALRKNGGVMTQAARDLGLKYTTFVAMVHRLDLTDPGRSAGED